MGSEIELIVKWLCGYGKIRCGEGMVISAMRTAGPAFADAIKRGEHLRDHLPTQAQSDFEARCGLIVQDWSSLQNTGSMAEIICKHLGGCVVPDHLPTERTDK